MLAELCAAGGRVIIVGILFVVLLVTGTGFEIGVGGLRFELSWMEGDLSWLLSPLRKVPPGILDVGLVLTDGCCTGAMFSVFASTVGVVVVVVVIFVVDVVFVGFSLVNLGRPNVES